MREGHTGPREVLWLYNKFRFIRYLFAIRLNHYLVRMIRQVIYASDLPGSPFYSHAVKAGGLVYLSGFVGVNPRTKKVEGDTIEAQTRQAIQNCEIVLKAAGSRLEDVVQVIVLLRDSADFDAMNREYSKFFSKEPPARAVAKLGVELPNVKVSIAMTALVSQD